MGTFTMLISTALVWVLLLRVERVGARPSGRKEEMSAKPVSADYSALQDILGRKLAGTPEEKANVVELLLQLLSEIDLPTLCEVISNDTRSKMEDLPESAVSSDVTEAIRLSGLVSEIVTAFPARNVTPTPEQTETSLKREAIYSDQPSLLTVPFTQNQNKDDIQDNESEEKWDLEKYSSHDDEFKKVDQEFESPHEEDMKRKHDVAKSSEDIFDNVQTSLLEAATSSHEVKDIPDAATARPFILTQQMNPLYNLNQKYFQTIREQKEPSLSPVYDYLTGELKTNMAQGNTEDATQNQLFIKSVAVERPKSELYSRALVLGDWVNEKNTFHADHKESEGDRSLRNNVAVTFGTESMLIPTNDKYYGSKFEKSFTRIDSDFAGGYENNVNYVKSLAHVDTFAESANAGSIKQDTNTGATGNIDDGGKQMQITEQSQPELIVSIMTSPLKSDAVSGTEYDVSNKDGFRAKFTSGKQFSKMPHEDLKENSNENMKMATLFGKRADKAEKTRYVISVNEKYQKQEEEQGRFYELATKSTYALPTEFSTYVLPDESVTYAHPKQSSTYALPKESSIYAFPKESAIYSLTKESATNALPNEPSTYAPPKESSTYTFSKEPATYFNSKESFRYALSKESSTYAIPKESSTYDLPNESSSHTLPNESSTYILPKEYSSYTLPKEYSSYTLPKESSTYALPNGSSSYTLPNESSTYVFHKESTIYALPTETAAKDTTQQLSTININLTERVGSEETLGNISTSHTTNEQFPKEYSSYTLPTESSTYAIPKESSSYTLPNEFSTYILSNESSSYILPNESSSYTLPNETSAYALPIKSSSYTLSNESSTYAIPKQSSTYALPNESSIYTLPKESSSYTLLKESSSYTLPNESSAYALPIESSSYTLPNESSTYALSEEYTSYALPNESSTYALPNESSAYALPTESSSYALPKESSSYTLPSESSTYALLKESSSYTVPNESSTYVFHKESTVYALPTETAAKDTTQQLSTININLAERAGSEETLGNISTSHTTNEQVPVASANSVKSVWNTSTLDLNMIPALNDTSTGKSFENSLITDQSNTSTGSSSENSLITDLGNTSTGKSFENSLITDQGNTSTGSSFENSLITDLGNTSTGKSFENSLITDQGNTSTGKSFENTLITELSNTSKGKSFENTLITELSNTSKGKSFDNSLITDLGNASTGKSFGNGFMTYLDKPGAVESFEDNMIIALNETSTAEALENTTDKVTSIKYRNNSTETYDSQTENNTSEPNNVEQVTEGFYNKRIPEMNEAYAKAYIKVDFANATYELQETRDDSRENEHQQWITPDDNNVIQERVFDLVTSLLVPLSADHDTLPEEDRRAPDSVEAKLNMTDPLTQAPSQISNYTERDSNGTGLLGIFDGIPLVFPSSLGKSSEEIVTSSTSPESRAVNLNLTATYPSAGTFDENILNIMNVDLEAATQTDMNGGSEALSTVNRTTTLQNGASYIDKDEEIPPQNILYKNNQTAHAGEYLLSALATNESTINGGLTENDIYATYIDTYRSKTQDDTAAHMKVWTPQEVTADFESISVSQGHSILNANGSEELAEDVKLSRNITNEKDNEVTISGRQSINVRDTTTGVLAMEMYNILHDTDKEQHSNSQENYSADTLAISKSVLNRSFTFSELLARQEQRALAAGDEIAGDLTNATDNEHMDVLSKVSPSLYEATSSIETTHTSPRVSSAASMPVSMMESNSITTPATILVSLFAENASTTFTDMAISGKESMLLSHQELSNGSGISETFEKVDSNNATSSYISTSTGSDQISSNDTSNSVRIVSDYLTTNQTSSNIPIVTNEVLQSTASSNNFTQSVSIDLRNSTENRMSLAHLTTARATETSLVEILDPSKKNYLHAGVNTYNESINQIKDSSDSISDNINGDDFKATRLAEDVETSAGNKVTDYRILQQNSSSEAAVEITEPSLEPQSHDSSHDVSRLNITLERLNITAYMIAKTKARLSELKLPSKLELTSRSQHKTDNNLSSLDYSTSSAVMPTPALVLEIHNDTNAFRILDADLQPAEITYKNTEQRIDVFNKTLKSSFAKSAVTEIDTSSSENYQNEDNMQVSESPTENLIVNLGWSFMPGTTVEPNETPEIHSLTTLDMSDPENEPATYSSPKIYSLFGETSTVIDSTRINEVASVMNVTDTPISHEISTMSVLQSAFNNLDTKSILDLHSTESETSTQGVDRHRTSNETSTVYVRDLPATDNEISTVNVPNLSVINYETSTMSIPDLLVKNNETSTMGIPDHPATNNETSTMSVSDHIVTNNEISTRSVPDLLIINNETSAMSMPYRLDGNNEISEKSVSKSLHKNNETFTMSGFDLLVTNTETSTTSMSYILATNNETLTKSVQDLLPLNNEISTTGAPDLLAINNETSTSVQDLLAINNETSIPNVQDLLTKNNETSTVIVPDLLTINNETATTIVLDLLTINNETSTTSVPDLLTINNETTTTIVKDLLTIINETSATSVQDLLLSNNETFTIIAPGLLTINNETATGSEPDLLTINNETSTMIVQDLFAINNETPTTSLPDLPTINNETSTTNVPDLLTINNETATTIVQHLFTINNETSTTIVPDLFTINNETSTTSVPVLPALNNETFTTNVPDILVINNETSTTSVPVLPALNNETFTTNVPDILVINNETSTTIVPVLPALSNKTSTKNMLDLLATNNETSTTNMQDLSALKNETSTMSMPDLIATNKETSTTNVPDILAINNETSTTSVPVLPALRNKTSTKKMLDLLATNNETSTTSMQDLTALKNETSTMSMPDLIATNNETSARNVPDISVTTNTAPARDFPFTKNNETSTINVLDLPVINKEISTFSKVDSSEKLVGVSQDNIRSYKGHPLDYYYNYGALEYNYDQNMDNFIFPLYKRTAGESNPIPESHGLDISYDLLPQTIEKVTYDVKPELHPYMSTLRDESELEQFYPKTTPIHPWKAFNIALGKQKARQNDKNAYQSSETEIPSYSSYISPGSETDDLVKDYFRKIRSWSGYKPNLNVFNAGVFAGNSRENKNAGMFAGNSMENQNADMFAGNSRENQNADMFAGNSRENHNAGLFAGNSRENQNTGNEKNDPIDFSTKISNKILGLDSMYNVFQDDQKTNKNSHRATWIPFHSQDMINFDSVDQDYKTYDDSVKLFKHPTLKQYRTFGVADTFAQDYPGYKFPTETLPLGQQDEEWQDKPSSDHRSVTYTSLHNLNLEDLFGDGVANKDGSSFVSQWASDILTPSQSTPAQNEYKCPGLFGYHRDPENCQAFFVCSWGMAHRVVCPPGTLYNPAMAVCDWAVNVRCPD